MSDASIAMPSRTELLGLALRLAALSTLSYYTVKWLMDAMDPTRKAKLKAEAQAKALFKSLGVDPKETEGIDEYELTIASQLVLPESMATSWKDIAGLDAVINEIKESVILPIKKRKLFAQSNLLSAPKGVLLHGPPGCGKTMIARATAKEAGARFINLDPSALQDKWYGESQKLAGAVFRLAVKIQPCIVFIDEIDSLLRARSGQDHEATALVKAQFMQMWDGLISDQTSTVIVMGATNRPRDVDAAIIRRMPATFHIGLPDIHQRRAILTQILRIESIDEDVDLTRLANLTEKFSGSDLREMCRTASVYRVRELSDDSDNEILRPISNDDLLKALAKMRESRVHCSSTLQTYTLD